MENLMHTIKLNHNHDITIPEEYPIRLETLHLDIDDYPDQFKGFGKGITQIIRKMIISCRNFRTIILSLSIAYEHPGCVDAVLRYIVRGIGSNRILIKIQNIGLRELPQIRQASQSVVSLNARLYRLGQDDIAIIERTLSKMSRLEDFSFHVDSNMSLKLVQRVLKSPNTRHLRSITIINWMEEIPTHLCIELRTKYVPFEMDAAACDISSGLRMSPINAVPAEVWSQIVSNLSLSDMNSFRLASRRACEYTEFHFKRLHKVISVTISKPGVINLRAYSQSRLWPYTRTVILKEDSKCLRESGNKFRSGMILRTLRNILHSCSHSLRVIFRGSTTNDRIVLAEFVGIFSTCHHEVEIEGVNANNLRRVYCSNNVQSVSLISTQTNKRINSSILEARQFLYPMLRWNHQGLLGFYERDELATIVNPHALPKWTEKPDFEGLQKKTLRIFHDYTLSTLEERFLALLGDNGFQVSAEKFKNLRSRGAPFFSNRYEKRSKCYVRL